MIISYRFKGKKQIVTDSERYNVVVGSASQTKMTVSIGNFF